MIPERTGEHVDISTFIRRGTTTAEEAVEVDAVEKGYAEQSRHTGRYFRTETYQVF